MPEIDLKKLRFENNLSQEKLGKILNITKQQISRIEKGKAKLTLKNFKILKEKYNLNLQSNINQQNYTLIKYYPAEIAACKDETFELSSNWTEYKIPLDLFKHEESMENYLMCHAVDNSMYPRIWSGDFIILEHKKNMAISNGQIYLFFYDDQIYLKKLSKNINQIVVESENPVFKTQYIEKDEISNLKIIGKVVCHGKLDKNLKIT